MRLHLEKDFVGEQALAKNDDLKFFDPSDMRQPQQLDFYKSSYILKMPDFKKIASSECLKSLSESTVRTIFSEVLKKAREDLHTMEKNLELELIFKVGKLQSKKGVLSWQETPFERERATSNQLEFLSRIIKT